MRRSPPRISPSPSSGAGAAMSMRLCPFQAKRLKTSATPRSDRLGATGSPRAACARAFGASRSLALSRAGPTAAPRAASWSPCAAGCSRAARALSLPAAAQCPPAPTSPSPSLRRRLWCSLQVWLAPDSPESGGAGVCVGISGCQTFKRSVRCGLFASSQASAIGVSQRHTRSKKAMTSSASLSGRTDIS